MNGKMKELMDQPQEKGFTLIELLVVFAITALVSAFTILYGSIGQNQVAVSVEAAKISQLMLQAKQLSLATYAAPTSTAADTCGYGVTFDFNNQTYSLFVYDPPNVPPQPCPTASKVVSLQPPDHKQYSAGTWQIPLPRGVVLKSTSPNNDIIYDVLFYPPAPTTLISRNGSSFVQLTSEVLLSTSDGSLSHSIFVSPQGQISS